VKITFFTQHYLPELGAPPARISGIATKLSNMGFDVNIITTVPIRTTKKKANLYKKFISIENKDNIKIFRIKISPLFFGKYINRILREFFFVVCSIIFLKKKIFNRDIIIVQNPPIFSGIIVFVKKIFFKNKKIIVWCSDIWPELLIELGKIDKKGLISKIMRMFQRITFGNADAIAVTTPKSVIQVKKNYRTKKIFLWMNSVDISNFTNKNDFRTYRNEWNIGSNKFVIGYAGLHGHFQNLKIVLEAAKLVLNKNIQFIFVGDGEEKNDLIISSKKFNLKNVIFLPVFEKEEMPDILLNFDAILIPLAKKMPTTIPSKFYEALAVGRPIITTDSMEVSQLISDNNLGRTYKVLDSNSLAKSCDNVSYLEDYERVKIGENCRRLSYSYDRQKVFKIILQDINWILKKND